MGIGETGSLKIRHRIGLVPDNVVQNPKSQILKNITDPENIVIGTDNPNGAVVFQYPAGGRHPFPGIFVIGGQRFKTVPFFINPRHISIVGAGQSIAELKIIRRIGKNQINRVFFHLIHNFNAVIINDCIKNFFGLDTAHLTSTTFLRFVIPMSPVWPRDSYKFINKNQNLSPSESKKLQAIDNLQFFIFTFSNSAARRL